MIYEEFDTASGVCGCGSGLATICHQILIQILLNPDWRTVSVFFQLNPVHFTPVRRARTKTQIQKCLVKIIQTVLISAENCIYQYLFNMFSGAFNTVYSTFQY